VGGGTLKDWMGGTYCRIRPWEEGAYCRIQSREDGATSEDRISERGLHRRTGSPGVGGGTHQWIGFLCSPNSSMVENIVHLKTAVRYESRGLGDVF
jgi:hypothetical protein